MFSFRIEGFEVDRSGKPAPLYLKECINIYIYIFIYLFIYLFNLFTHIYIYIYTPTYVCV